jgi:hypothetical protein
VEIAIKESEPFIFFTENKKQGGKDLNLLRSASGKKAPIEEILRAWIKGGSYEKPKRVTFTRFDRSNAEVANIILEENEEPVIYSDVSLRYLKKVYGGFRSLTEDVYSYADIEGRTLDQTWFDARNKKLRIKDSEDWEFLLAPPSAIYELTMSYAMSSFGFARITRGLTTEKEYIPRSVYKLELVYLGKHEADDTWWVENLIVREDKLEKYLERKENN